ncbi:MAG: hypothetical protein AABZ83_01105, partial [candidate division NC10 bacterium]
ACGGSPPPPLAQAPKPPVAAAPPVATAAKPPLVPAVPEAAGPEIPKYEIKGRRDPFETLEVKEGAGSIMTSARLTGIVRSARATLALVETPEGLGYILKPGDTLGDGRLLEIGSDSVVFQVPPKPGSPTNRVVLKLATN